MNNMKRKMLLQLEDALTEHPHTWNQLNLEAWKVDRPYMWSVVYHVDSVNLVADTGYGLMALFINNVLHDIGHTFVFSKDTQYVGLSPAYLGDKYSVYKHYSN